MKEEEKIKIYKILKRVKLFGKIVISKIKTATTYLSSEKGVATENNEFLSKELSYFYIKEFKKKKWRYIEINNK